MNRKIAKLLILILVVGGIMSTGYMALSASSSYITLFAPDKAGTDIKTELPNIKDIKPKRDINNISTPPAKKALVVSKEIENKITSLDKVNAAKNIKNYKDLLVNLKATEKLQKEIEKMYTKGYKVQDVLTAYTFLYDNYGTVGELEGLLSKKKSGKGWTAIFKEYNENKKVFVPRNFASNELESLMQSTNLTADDIMTADRISQKGIGTFENMINKRMKGWDWQDINSELDIINTSGKFSRVAVDNEKLEKYVQSTHFTKSQIVKAFIIASKMGKSESEILAKLEAGSTEEDILAQSYVDKYEK